MSHPLQQISPDSIEKIVDVRSQDGEREYLIEWKRSWISSSQLKQCMCLVEKFYFERSPVSVGNVSNICKTIENISFKDEVNDTTDIDYAPSLTASKTTPSVSKYNSPGVLAIRKPSENGSDEVHETKSTHDKKQDDHTEGKTILDLRFEIKHDKQTSVKIDNISGKPKNEVGATKKEVAKVKDGKMTEKQEKDSTTSTIVERHSLFNRQSGIKLEVFPRVDWHSSDNVKQQILDFYNKHAKTPNADLKEARVEVDILVKKIHMELKGKGLCKNTEFTGSTYEGLKITEDGLEFDVMFIMDGTSLEAIEIDEYSGYCNFLIKENAKENEILKAYQSFLDPNGNVISPEKVVSKYISEINLIYNEFSEKEKERIKIRKNGPAVAFTVKNKNGALWFKVDLVPCIEVSKECIKGVTAPVRYVAKPLNEPTMSDLLQFSWRRSTSKEEKDFLKKIDANNECRKKSIQIVKAICKRDSTLSTIESFYLKTILFHILSQNLPLTWGANDYYCRVFDILGFIQQYLDNKFLPQYFVPSMNILDGFSDKQLANMADRIKKLRSSEVKFLKIIQT